MPELLRTIAIRLREVFGNRRRAPRYKIQLAVAVSLLDSRARTHPASLEGYTRDISATGLALILPAIRIGDRYLTGGSHMLRIMLKLPGGPVQLHGLPVRYEQLEEGETQTGYLIGLEIKEMSEQDRALFDQYLRTLKRRG